MIMPASVASMTRTAACAAVELRLSSFDLLLARPRFHERQLLLGPGVFTASHLQSHDGLVVGLAAEGASFVELSSALQVPLRVVQALPRHAQG